MKFVTAKIGNIIKKDNKDRQINEEIRDKEVRLIGSDGQQLGIVSAYEAQRMADDLGLDYEMSSFSRWNRRNRNHRLPMQ